MPPGIVLASPPSVAQLQQQGLLERAFHDGLFPNLGFRAEAMPEEWPAHTGTSAFMTRAGLLATITTPTKPGEDPIPQSVPFEQWVAILQQFSGAVDTHMPSSTTANANLFLRNLHQLGLQAGQSINQIARNALFQAYLSGQTVLLAATGAGDTSIRVSALNGFTEVVLPAGNVQPQPSGTLFPHPITIGTVGGAPAQISATVVGFTPDDPEDLLGPGTLQLSAAVGFVFPIRTTLKSAFAPRIVRSAAGDSVDAISGADTLTMQQCFNAVAMLRRANVQPHDDGFYHAHISPLANAQVFSDAVFQRLNQSLPQNAVYTEGFVGSFGGIMFFMNNETPETTNSGKLTATGQSGVYAAGIGGEVTNGAGVNIGRCIITGRGAIYERYLDEGAFVTEAGTTGKTGEFDVVNNSIKILTEGIRLILRAPLDRLQQKVSAAWSITTSFPVPSDITAASGPERWKRAVICEMAV